MSTTMTNSTNTNRIISHQYTCYFPTRMDVYHFMNEFTSVWYYKYKNMNERYKMSALQYELNGGYKNVITFRCYSKKESDRIKSYLRKNDICLVQEAKKA